MPACRRRRSESWQDLEAFGNFPAGIAFRCELIGSDVFGVLAGRFIEIEFSEVLRIGCVEAG